MNSTSPFQGLRSPREIMAGWVYLPRFVDKIRLHLKNQLPDDYKGNFCKGFDGMWLKHSGANQDEFIKVVSEAKGDPEVESWVKQNIRKTPEEIQLFNEALLSRGKVGEDSQQRLAQRKASCGFADRADIQTFVDLIDADEGRLPASS